MWNRKKWERRLYLEDVDVGGAIGPMPASIHLDVFEPLDVWLSITVHLTLKLNITAHHHRLIGRESSLQDGPVRWALWLDERGDQC